MKEKINIIWCKKNLRVQDNEILENLNTQIPTLGVYFFEPEIITFPDYSNFHLQFIFESLLELQTSYIKIGIPLLLLPYDAVEGFQKILCEYHISNIYTHQETGNWKTYKRDKNVILFCKNNDIKLREYVTNGVVRKLKNRDNWNKIWKARMSKDMHIIHQVGNVLQVSKNLCTISKNTKQKYLNYFKKNTNKYLQKGGESEGVKILGNFLENRSKKYMYNISKPYESQTWCSRLSPYISNGCLSLKLVVQATEKKREELKHLATQKAVDHRKSLQYFISRLHWQSHFIQKLEDEPEIEFRNLNTVFDSIRQVPDYELINTVFSAKSGIPYIDALIRQLHKTGWCNFRSRAVLVSFLCNTCQQPWQEIAPKVAALFTDYEPGIHYPQFQMQAGTTGINTIRVYNPVYNGKQKDSEGKFIYYYLPELKTVPVAYIHEPHLWDGFESINYPEPIIEIKSANKIVKDILWDLKGNISNTQKKSIIKKHASRVFQGDRKMKMNTKVNQNQTSLF